MKRRSKTTGNSYLRKRALELATPTTRATSDPLADWALKKIRLDGRPFSFEGHEYLRAIYDDTSPHMVLSKAAQIGGTTWAILRAFHACLSGLNTIYFFPTRTDVNDFSRSRVGPLLYDNPFLLANVKDTDTVGLKRIGDGFLYFRGMQSSVGMKSVPADLIAFDELDEATPDARTLAWERIAHSAYKRVIELSNPSLPGYGIDEQFEKSDQRHWTLKCPCGRETALEREFPVKLGKEVTIIRQREDGSYYRACPKCGKELDLTQGRWVPDFPNRQIHGYRVSQLFSAMVDPGEILQEYRSTRHPDRFYNLKIGIPWADLDRRVDVQTTLALCRSGEPPSGHHVMGVDTGNLLHTVILRTHGYDKRPGHIVHLQECETYQDLDRLMTQFNVQVCVIDGMPEIHAVRDFAKRYEWRREVYLNFFNENQRGMPRWDKKEFKVEINRTEALDASRAILRAGKVTLPQRSPIVEVFARHIACDAKVPEEDEETGAKRFKYVRTGANHFSMAFTYALMALDKMDMPLSPEQWYRLQRLVEFD